MTSASNVTKNTYEGLDHMSQIHEEREDLIAGLLEMGVNEKFALSLTAQQARDISAGLRHMRQRIKIIENEEARGNTTDGSCLTSNL